MNLWPNIISSSCLSCYWLKICSRLCCSNALGHQESCEFAFSFSLFCRLRVQNPRSLLHCADIPRCCNWWLFMQNFIVSCCIYRFEDVLSNLFWRMGVKLSSVPYFFVRLRVQDPRSLLHKSLCRYPSSLQLVTLHAKLYCFLLQLLLWRCPSNLFWHHGCEIVLSFFTSLFD